MSYFAMMDWILLVNIHLWAQGGGDGACSDTVYVESTVLTIGWILLVDILLWAASFRWQKVVVLLFVAYVLYCL